MQCKAGSDTAIPRTAIVAAAERGDPEAQLRLAEQLAEEGQGKAALLWLARAAKTGHPQSFALLGAWQLLGYNLQRNADEGMQRLEIAARHGDDTAAAFLANVYSSGLAGSRDWSRALDWLVEAARLGNARALTQLALLQRDPINDPHRSPLLAAAVTNGFDAAAAMQAAVTSGDVAPVAIDTLPWPTLRANIDVAALLDQPFAGGARFESPAIATYSDVASEDFCRYVIGVAMRQLERAMVNEPHRGRSAHEMRTNSCMTIVPTNGDVLLQILNERLARLTGEPVEYQENTTVLRYRPGEIYDNHYDFFNPDVAQFQHEIERRGQRTMTALIYLSEDFEGGETEFPELAWSFHGRRGDAIVWSNVRPDGSPEPRSLHAGRPPRWGEKWVLSKWIRSKPQSTSS